VALPSTALISRDTFDRVGFFDETFRGAEETEFFHRAAAETRAAFVMATLADYRVGHASLIKNDTSSHIRFAIESIDRASRLRSLTGAERALYHEGRSRLQSRLAYCRLSALDRTGARAALLDSRRAGGSISAKDIAVFVASLLPIRALRSLHAVKRRFGG
jgi:GT2 family glycosyltransferase